MTHTLIRLCLLIIIQIPAFAYAVTVYECADENGDVAFRDRCPPDTTMINEMKFSTKRPGGDAPDVSITFYTVPTCDACDVVRNVLDKYGAQYTEKDVKQDVALQRELQEKTGQQETLSVPTVIIGKEVIIGHNKQNLVSLLEEAGFKLPGAEGGKSTPENPWQ